MDYITIIQGDDTNFLDDQFVMVNFKTNIDLSGFTATFTLGDVTLTYGNLSDQSFEIILSNEITSNLKIGKQYGELKLIDNNHRIRTVSSVIPFIVKKGVDETITFVNNSLNVSMNINDTVIDIYVETSGISNVEAQRIMANCRDAEQAAANYSNTAQNSLIALNQSIDSFEYDYNELSGLLESTQNTCSEAIAEATAQADRAEAKADEVEAILESSSDADLNKLSPVGNDKINQSKALITGNISEDSAVYNQILQSRQASVESGIDIIENNYTLNQSTAPLLDGEVSVTDEGVTSGLSNDNCSVSVPVEMPLGSQYPFHIHIESIITNQANTYICSSEQYALSIQMQYNGSLCAYLYADDGNTKWLSTDALAIAIGDRYIIDVGYNAEDGFYAKASCNNQTVEDYADIGTAWLRNAITNFCYGRNSWSFDCNVEVDLTKSYFEVNGKITRPLVQIPYDLTSTGSKIVDAEYRETIEEIYNKNGVANYYTIDTENENFTLPMGEIYGMINKSIENFSSVELSDNQILQILNALAPDTSVIVKISSTLSADSPYVTNCAGWYVVLADTTAKRYLYINGKETSYCIPGTNGSVSVFLGKGDSIYWSGSLGVIYSHTFIPAKGCKYKKTAAEDLEDLFG